MRFVIKSVSNTIDVWDHESEDRDRQGEFHYDFCLDCVDNSRLDINDDYVLCSLEYYESHSEELKSRTRLECVLSVSDRDAATQERENYLGKRFGYGYVIGNTFRIHIYLRHEIFKNFIKHVESYCQVGLLLITFKNDKDNSITFGSSWDGSHEIVRRSEEHLINPLSIEQFHVHFGLVNKKEAWEIEYEKEKLERLKSQKKQELMDTVEHAVTVSYQKAKDDSVGKLFIQFKPYLTLITLLLAAIVLKLLFK